MIDELRVTIDEPNVRRHGMRGAALSSRFTFHVSRFTHPVTTHSLRAFSLIEILVTVGILSFIILGLLAMFNQTQRAFRTGMTQNDVLESGRSVVEMVGRDLEQMTPSETPASTNFLAEVVPPFRFNGAFTPAYFFQELPGTTATKQYRTNVFQHFFFLTRENLRWTGIGYLVDTPTNGFGTLYRFQSTDDAYNTLVPSSITNLIIQFQTNALLLYSQSIVSTNLRRVADGVVDLRLRPYGPSGIALSPTNFLLNTLISTNRLPAPIQATDVDCFFYSNAVPAYVELEIGFLEDRTLSRLKSLPDINNAQSLFLQTHSPQVHLFRQRIAIRNVDLTAYPYP